MEIWQHCRFFSPPHKSFIWVTLDYFCPIYPKKNLKMNQIFWALFYFILPLPLSQWGVGGETLLETPLRASPAVISMWSCTVKMDEENPTCTGLTQEIGFGSAQFRPLPCLVRGAAALCTCRKECNKYDLTAPQCFWLAHHNDWSMWFAINNPPPYLLSQFQFFW